MWGYSYPQWPLQPYTTTTLQHPPYTSATGHVDVNKTELCDGSREDPKESCKSPKIVDSPCNFGTDIIDDVSVTDTSPDSKTNEPRLSLSSLKRDYSSSSSDAATPTSSGSAHHHGNNSATSSPWKPVDISKFEQQVMEFTSSRTKMLRNIKARPLSLPTDNRSTGNQLVEMRHFVLKML